MTKYFYTKETELSGIIFNNPNLLLMLEHFGISLPLQELSIQKICDIHQLNPDLFINIMNLYASSENIYTTKLSISDIPALLNYLKHSHKYYLEEIYPFLLELLKQLHIQNNHDEIIMVENFFNDYFNEVKEHLNYENEVVFPYVENLLNSITDISVTKNLLDYKVNQYKEHHSDIEEKLNDLKNLLIKYLPLKGEQQILRKLIYSLFELDYDLKVHAKIEDFILVPLVENLEKLAIQKA